MVVESIPKFFGFAYGLVMIVVIAYRWYSGRWRQTVGRLLLVISTASGFLIFAPMVPVQFQLLVLGDLQGLGAPLTIGLAGLSMVVLLTLVFGRFFCGTSARSVPFRRLRTMLRSQRSLPEVGDSRW